MDERIARLLAHQKNMDRYQSLLESKLSDDERQYLERRLSEERVAIEMLNLMSSAMAYDLPGTPERTERVR